MKIEYISPNRLTHTLVSIRIPPNMNDNLSVRFFSYYYFFGTGKQLADCGA